MEKLEADLTTALAKERANQDIIESFRKYKQDMHDYFDNILKKMEVLDKGSGLSCPEKVNAISELTNDFNNNGSKKLEGFINIAKNVIDVVSNLDSQQVEEEVSIQMFTFF